jgi:hypothetical protein
MNNSEILQKVEKAADWASTTTYGGGLSAVIFGLTAQEIGIYGGLLIGLLGFIGNMYFKHKAHQLELLKMGLGKDDNRTMG